MLICFFIKILGRKKLIRLKKDISLYLVLNRILNELNEQVVEHGERVAYLYLKMAEYRGLPDDEKMENMMLACYAHDIGAYKTEKFLDLLRFDVTNTSEHCIYGYLFMKYFSPIRDAAEVLLYHHTFYTEHNKIKNDYIDDGILIHFLDRIDVLDIIGSEEEMMHQIREVSGTNFNPRDVEDFIKANEKYGLMAHISDGSFKKDVREYFDREERVARLIDPVIAMLSFEVDFKSEQTVIHTITTTLFAGIFAEKLGLSELDKEKVQFAARIHDLGKIDVPQEIVEKPGKLTKEEYDEMKNHVVYTEKITSDIMPASVVQIAAHHHERLDGSGYPKGLKAEALSIEDRIVQVADVVSALLQKRSYKDVMEKDLVLKILNEDADNGKLDADIVKMFSDEYDEIVGNVLDMSKESIQMYENLQEEYKYYLKESEESGLKETDEFGLFSGIR